MDVYIFWTFFRLSTKLIFVSSKHDLIKWEIFLNKQKCEKSEGKRRKSQAVYNFFFGALQIVLK